MTEIAAQQGASMAGSKVGVDTGGTFTDFVRLDAAGRMHIFKELSTPHDPAIAILRGIVNVDPTDETDVVHGSTVATNALLERRGARTGLITTKGFADVLAIGRQNRPELYALVPQKPEALVRSEWRFEVEERVSSGGEILTPLDPVDLQPILRQLEINNINSVAVCLLFSFLRPEHELLIKELLYDWSGTKSKQGHPAWPAKLHVSISSEILPEFREFERTATTVINAYVAPLMSDYLNRLHDELAPRNLTVMQSNGGISTAATAGEQAARTVLSGPAGGVVGARYVAGLAGYHDIITFDMGGTSTDVALCPGRLPTTSEGEIAGLPLRLPMIDIHTVGAGGGSIAYVDPGGALQVGPQSAGADPGPACYPRRVTEGGEEVELFLKPTTTDANLVLGRLDAAHFLGGSMRLNMEPARDALQALAREMEVGPAEAAALGVIGVANANMERAMRRISVERGYDPRDFTLVAFGGAGPLHACELASSMQIPRVLVPPVPGVLSALGMLVAEPMKDYSVTIMHELAESPERADLIAGRFEHLAERAIAEMHREGYSASTVSLLRSLDMRYVGQSHELTVELKENQDLQHLRPLLDNAHERRYGYRRPEAAAEIVNIRLRAVARSEKPRLVRGRAGDTDPSSAIVGRKMVHFGDNSIRTLLYDRERLLPGNRFSGPAIVFQYDTTTVVPPGWTARVDGFANLILSYAI